MPAMVMTLLLLLKKSLICPRFSGLCRRKNSLRALQKYPLAGLPHVTMSHQFYEDFFAEQGDVYKRQVQGAAGWLDLAIHSLF